MSLFDAIGNNDIKLVHKLIKNGADINGIHNVIIRGIRFVYTPLTFALRLNEHFCKYNKIVIYLIKRKAKIHNNDCLRDYLYEHYKKQIIKHLIKFNVMLNTVNYRGNSTLMEISNSYDLNRVKLLINHGSHLFIQNTDKKTDIISIFHYFSNNIFHYYSNNIFVYYLQVLI